jgi:hypothetical protein
MILPFPAQISVRAQIAAIGISHFLYASECVPQPGTGAPSDGMAAVSRGAVHEVRIIFAASPTCGASHPKPHEINELPAASDSEVRHRGGGAMMRTSV